jgi:hypothetical protein
MLGTNSSTRHLQNKSAFTPTNIPKITDAPWKPNLFEISCSFTSYPPAPSLLSHPQNHSKLHVDIDLCSRNPDNPSNMSNLCLCRVDLAPMALGSAPGFRQRLLFTPVGLFLVFLVAITSGSTMVAETENLKILTHLPPPDPSHPLVAPPAIRHAFVPSTLVEKRSASSDSGLRVK